MNVLVGVNSVLDSPLANDDGERHELTSVTDLRQTQLEAQVDCTHLVRANWDLWDVEGWKTFCDDLKKIFAPTFRRCLKSYLRNERLSRRKLHS